MVKSMERAKQVRVWGSAISLLVFFLSLAATICSIRHIAISQYTDTRVPLMLTLSRMLPQVPHFTYGDELDMSALVELRKQLKPIAETRGVNLSYLPFILKAMSLALNQYPMINAHVNDDCTEVTYRVRWLHFRGLVFDVLWLLMFCSLSHMCQEAEKRTSRVAVIICRT